MPPEQWIIALIRILNLVVWIDLGYDWMRHSNVPLPYLTRRLVVLVIVLGFTALVIGAFAPVYVDPANTRLMYTVYTAFAAVAGFAIRRTWRS